MVYILFYIQPIALRKYITYIIDDYWYSSFLFAQFNILKGLAFLYL